MATSKKSTASKNTLSSSTNSSSTKTLETSTKAGDSTVFSSELTTKSTNQPMSKLTMRLFGLPYQFPEAVDPRVTTISKVIGKKFTENIMLEAPICTIIPGKPKYLPNSASNTRSNTTTAFIKAAGGDLSSLNQIIKDNSLDDMRLYDFERDYMTYMAYVNALCRAGASFLGLNDTIPVGTSEYSFQQYDWKNYRWNTTANQSIISKGKTAIKSVKSTSPNTSTTQTKFDISTETGTETSVTEVLTDYNYVQFYIDSDVSPSENIANTTSESQMKSLFDSGASMMKEIAFMANSGGMDANSFNTFANDSLNSLSAGVQQVLGNNKTIVGTASGALSRLINLSGDVIKGNNLIMPDIYQNSTYSKSYSITVHLKTPYGTKLGYYMDIFVPMMHLLALALPKQESANSFSSPFLVKAYVEGLFTCNLGMVESIAVQKISESWSTEGLPSEVDVTLNINDLYSDLSMSPSTAPILFINNSSLIEYIATNCGMSLVQPNYKAKYEALINSMKAAFKDIPSSIKGIVNQSIYDAIASLTSLY